MHDRFDTLHYTESQSWLKMTGVLPSQQVLFFQKWFARHLSNEPHHRVNNTSIQSFVCPSFSPWTSRGNFFLSWIMSQHFLWISYARMKQDFWKAIQTVKYTWNSAAEASTMKLNNLITVYWSEGSYFIIRFWFQASIMKGTQKVSGAGSSKLLWWFQRA